MAGQDEDIRPIGYEDEVHQPFDVQAQKGQYAMWKLMGALAFLIILALLVFFIYQPGARDRGDPVVISPAKTALKIPPNETPTEPIADKSIYSAGSNNGTSEPITTVNPEAPIQLPKTVDIVEKDTPPSKVPSTVRPPKTVTQVPAKRPSVQGKTLPPGTTSTTRGNYLVQVASLRSYEEAEAAWNRITAKNTFLRGQLYDIKRVDLNEKGVYYRLRIDGLSSTAQAEAICGKLKANGQACFKTGR